MRHVPQTTGGFRFGEVSFFVPPHDLIAGFMTRSDVLFCCRATAVLCCGAAVSGRSWLPLMVVSLSVWLKSARCDFFACAECLVT